MLLWLAGFLEQYASFFNVFQYLTFRGILGVLTALAIAFLVGPKMIEKLSHYQIGQAVRDDGPQSHLSKAGTPTMGGALILVAIIVSTILWADLSNRYIWVVLAVTIVFGAVGWVDDYRKVVQKNSRGLPGKWKYFWQSVGGLGAALMSIPFTTVLAEFGHGEKNMASKVSGRLCWAKLLLIMALMPFGPGLRHNQGVI